MSSGTSFFGRLPMWAKILFALFYPVSVPYGVYRMWKTQRFSKPARIALSCAAGLFLLLMVSVATTPETQTAGPPAQRQESAVTESRTTEATAPAEESTKPNAPEPPDAVALLELKQARVTRVVDGDTAYVEFTEDGKAEKVRFIGVDTPESTTQVEIYGKEASAFTSKQLSGKTVYLETDAELRDKYDRLLAYVWLSVPENVSADGVVPDSEIAQRLFNARLLRDGYGELLTIPPNVKYVEAFKAAQTEARSADRGLWDPALVAAPKPAPKPKPKPTPKPAPEPDTAAYIGNRSTHKFHYASCRWVGEMNPSNKVPLSSREAAISAGYVPCKVCDP